MPGPFPPQGGPQNPQQQMTAEFAFRVFSIPIEEDQQREESQRLTEYCGTMALQGWQLHRFVEIDGGDHLKVSVLFLKVRPRRVQTGPRNPPPPTFRGKPKMR